MRRRWSTTAALGGCQQNALPLLWWTWSPTWLSIFCTPTCTRPTFSERLPARKCRRWSKATIVGQVYTVEILSKLKTNLERSAHPEAASGIRKSRTQTKAISREKRRERSWATVQPFPSRWRRLRRIFLTCSGSLWLEASSCGTATLWTIRRRSSWWLSWVIMTDGFWDDQWIFLLMAPLTPRPSSSRRSTSSWARWDQIRGQSNVYLPAAFQEDSSYNKMWMTICSLVKFLGGPASEDHVWLREGCHKHPIQGISTSAGVLNGYINFRLFLYYLQKVFLHIPVHWPEVIILNILVLLIIVHLSEGLQLPAQAGPQEEPSGEETGGPHLPKQQPWVPGIWPDLRAAYQNRRDLLHHRPWLCEWEQGWWGVPEVWGANWGFPCLLWENLDWSPFRQQCRGQKWSSVYHRNLEQVWRHPRGEAHHQQHMSGLQFQLDGHNDQKGILLVLEGFLNKESWSQHILWEDSMVVGSNKMEGSTSRALLLCRGDWIYKTGSRSPCEGLKLNDTPQLHGQHCQVLCEWLVLLFDG